MELRKASGNSALSFTEWAVGSSVLCFQPQIAIRAGLSFNKTSNPRPDRQFDRASLVSCCDAGFAEWFSVRLWPFSPSRCLSCDATSSPVRLSGFTGVIARFSDCQWDFLLRFFQEMFDQRDHPLLLRKQGEVAGVRDHGKLAVGNELEGLKRVFKADKIMISYGDENRRFDGKQFFVRKSFPLNAANLAPKLGPVIRIGSHFLVVFSLKLDAPGVRGRRVVKTQHFRGRTATPLSSEA
jgi:hypothetical protein